MDNDNEEKCSTSLYCFVERFVYDWFHVSTLVQVATPLLVDKENISVPIFFFTQTVEGIVF
jgi:hypothetical protein